MKEGILCSFFTCKLLDIIQYQYIDQTIEVQEIINLVFQLRLCKLRLKNICCHVQYDLVREILFDRSTPLLDRISAAAPELSVFAVVVGDAFKDSPDACRRNTFQLTVKFSPRS